MPDRIFKLDPTIVFPPVGRCIYCGTHEPPLTKEHIIPLGLGGTLLLPRASCNRHGDITKKFEGDIQRRMMGNFRMTANLPTRRPKERPESIKTTIRLGEDASTSQEAEFSIDHYPIGLTLLIFEPPGIIAGRAPSVMMSARVWQHVRPREGGPGGAWFSTGGIQPLTFGKMLCKIAHGFAVAQLGMGVFEPLTIPIIDGEMEEFTHYVGSDQEIPPASDSMHELRMLETSHNGTKYLEVTIRLFALLGSPVYRVIVGRV